MRFLIETDSTVTRSIFSLPHALMSDFFFLFFSFAGSFGLIWIGMFLYIFYKQVKENPAFALPFLATIAISSIVTNLILKPFIERARPGFSIRGSEILDFANKLNDNTFLKHFAGAYPRDFAFPSGHSTLAFAAATVLSSYEPKYKIAYYVVAGLIAFSRVYLGFHYVGDVVAGGLIGWLTGVVMLRITQ